MKMIRIWPKIAIILVIFLTLGSQWYLADVRIIRWDPTDIHPFFDAEDGGGSQLTLHESTEVIDASYVISPKIDYPYVGVSIDLEDSTGNCENWEKVKYIEYDFEVDHPTIAAVDLKNWDPGRSQKGMDLSYRILRKEVQLGKGKQTIKVDINNLHMPDWIRKEQKIPNEDEERFLDQVCILDWAGGDVNQPINRIVLSQMRLTYDYFYWKLSTGILGGLLIVGLVLYDRRLNLLGSIHAKVTENREAVKERIRELEVPSEWPAVLEWVKSNFEDSELSLDKASSELGMSGTKLSHLIKSQTELSFKAFVNEIRLERACMLLKETDEQVLQIALNCGYNTVAHFNRLFKEKYGSSPSKWRKDSK